MDKLHAFIRSDALEVRAMQPLLEENLWLLNPKWAEADGQTTYTELLREHFPEKDHVADEDRRIDILGVTASGSLTVVEIKRPNRTVSKSDLRQLADYVDWMENHFKGTNRANAPKYINGLLIVGKLSNSGEVQSEMRRLRNSDIRVETYDELHTAAREYYGHAEKVLKTVAPEYAKAKRQAARKKTVAGRKHAGKKERLAARRVVRRIAMGVSECNRVACSYVLTSQRFNDAAQCRRAMQSNRGRTLPERAFARVLWKRGHRYLTADGYRRRSGERLLGAPDLVFTKARVLVFVDGCFWHGCRRCKKLPATYSAFWVEKIAANRARDVKTRKALRRMGWKVFRIWEHDLRRRADFEKSITHFDRLLARERQHSISKRLRNA